jgi:hypothetical protein
MVDNKDFYYGFRLRYFGLASCELLINRPPTLHSKCLFGTPHDEFIIGVGDYAGELEDDEPSLNWSLYYEVNVQDIIARIEGDSYRTRLT